MLLTVFWNNNARKGGCRAESDEPQNRGRTAARAGVLRGQLFEGHCCRNPLKQPPGGIAPNPAGLNTRRIQAPTRWRPPPNAEPVKSENRISAALGPLLHPDWRA